MKQLGYDYESLIPTVSYSGLVGECAHADDDVSSGVRVTSAFRCAYDGNMARFSHVSAVSSSLVAASHAPLRHRSTAALSSTPAPNTYGELATAAVER